MSLIYEAGDAVTFFDWWPETVALHTLEWGQEFDYEGTIYTLHRGNGMYPWVLDPNGERFPMYFGEQVTPLS